VVAINELVNRLNTASGIADNLNSSSKTWSSNKIAAEINEFSQALENELLSLIGGAPVALNNLKKIADAIGNNPNYANFVASALEVRVRFDAPQTLNVAEKEIARNNIGAISLGDLGTVVDYSLIFKTGLL
jgi:hypothetical protein